ncbi:MAG TPA: hypothetical protein VEA63_09640, partial [Opitutus sp.]|nr:hypothetical protein [Opitutus sp.]
VYRGGTRIATNDNWDADALLAAEISAASTAINTSQLASGSKDAALLLTLPPEIYTVHVTGGAASSGTALVEIYEITE